MHIFFWILYIPLTFLLGLVITEIAMQICSEEKKSFTLKNFLPMLGYRISLIHIAGGILTAFISILIILKFIILQIDSFSELIIVYLFAIIMIIAVISDIKYQIIPNKVTYFSIGLFLILRLFIHPLPIWGYLFGAIISSGILLLLAIVSRGGMGGGDIKLFVVIGLVLGWQDTLLALFLSAFIGGIISIILLIFKLVNRKQMIPFGPFIFIGTMVAYFLGNQIWMWYLP